MLFGFMSRLSYGPITSMRIVLVIVCATLFIKRHKVKTILQNLDKHSISKAKILLMGVLIITCIHSLGNQYANCEYFSPFEIITIVIGIMAVGIWCVLEIKSFDRFIFLLSAVGLIQGISVFISFVYAPFQSFIIDNFMTEEFVSKVEEADIADLARTPGIGLAWSSGSLIMSFCCLGLIALKARERISTIEFAVAYSIIMGGTALMGRTGLIVELCFLLYFCVTSGKKSVVLGIVLSGILGLLGLNWLMSQIDPVIAEATQRWMFAFLDGEAVSRTNEGVTKDGFPPFSLDFLIGTGVRYGHYEGYNFYADSGYIKSYTSIGIIGMLCYYGGLLNLMLSGFSTLISKNIKRLLYLAVLALLIVEYKEPFFKFFTYSWVVFTMGLLYTNEANETKEYLK